MTNLLWPGDHRAGDLCSDNAFVDAMTRVEQAWLTVLTRNRLAPADANAELPCLEASAVTAIAEASEQAANPVVPLVAELRTRLPEPPASWLHRGLTSQDVLDTAIMLCISDTFDWITGRLRTQLIALIALAEQHRNTLMLARTLTQPALPTTFGTHVSSWVDALTDAFDDVVRLRRQLPLQAGGGAGTLAASTEIARAAGATSPEQATVDLSADFAAELGLAAARPWHTTRTPVTRVADALTQCTDAWGRISRDVLQATRAESGELEEPAASGRGGSSTMPHKSNPVLSILLHRSALAAPGLAATLHTAAASAVEARPDGSWHAEWDTLATLARRTAVAADHASELLTGLTVNAEAMARNLDAVHGLDAEQQSIAALTGTEAHGCYRGAADQLIDHALGRARTAIQQS